LKNEGRGGCGTAKGITMAKESLQKKLSRVRPPRVHITYDVETNGSIEKREIPFVMGVLADLSGQPEQPLPPLKDRKFVEIDKDTFDKILGQVNPRLAFKVDNRLSEDDTRLGIELRFNSMADFKPAAVAKQIPALRKLLELRNAMHNLRASLIGNDKLESILQEVLKNHEAMQRIGAEGGSGTSAETGKEA
jgi:type VI secretion system protein ImpB